MKQFIIALTLVFSFIICAQSDEPKPGTGVGGDSGGTKYTWNQIADAANMAAKFPKFLIEGIEVSYDQLCVMGERIRTKKKYPNPKPGNGDGPDKIGTYLSSERSYQQEVCVKRVYEACVEYETRTVEIPLKMEIEVMMLSEDSTESWEFGFKKEYKLPICDTWKLTE